MRGPRRRDRATRAPRVGRPCCASRASRVLNAMHDDALMSEPPPDLDRRERQRLDRTGFQLVFDEDFTGDTLDLQRWIPHYLPHWTTPERSAARYDLSRGRLRLRIDTDQPAWRVPDGEMRVSNLQTGAFSGPVGSTIGQHRHRPDLTVVTAQRTRRLYTPSAGLVEATMRATPEPTCMLAFWLVGFEASPDASGELCVAELFGNAIQPQRSHV